MANSSGELVRYSSAAIYFANFNPGVDESATKRSRSGTKTQRSRAGVRSVASSSAAGPSQRASVDPIAVKAEIPVGAFTPSTVKIPNGGYLTLPFPTPTNEEQFLKGMLAHLDSEITQRQEWRRMLSVSLDELKNRSGVKGDDDDVPIADEHDAEGEDEDA